MTRSLHRHLAAIGVVTFTLSVGVLLAVVVGHVGRGATSP